MTANNELPTGQWIEILLAMVLTLLVLMFCSCARTQYVETVEVQYRDSVVERVVLDTVMVPVYIEIPAQSAERVTRDSVSTLENDYAVSEAMVDSQGTLHHWLKTKPQKVETEVPVVQKHKELEVFREEKERARNTKYIEVEKSLHWWQTALMWGGGVLFAAMIGCLIYVVVRMYKRMKIP